MGQIVGIQWLRAAAALLVAFGHALHESKTQALRQGVEFERVHWLAWNAGVDLFFVISGFIMVYASQSLFGTRGAGTAFLTRRVARIVPVYWFFLALALAWMFAQARLLGGKPAPDAGDIVTSFLFWPHDSFEDGMPRPFFTLGWTLNYEMLFYAVFALFVGFRRERAVAGVTAVLAALVALGLAMPGLPVALAVWSKPIVLEFALGMGIALAWRRGLVIDPALRLALFLTGVAILALDPLATGAQGLDWITPNDMVRLAGWGLPAAAIVLAVACGPREERAEGPIGRLFARLGDASYVLYLLHLFVILGTSKVWTVADLDERLGFWPLVIASLLASCTASLVAHRLVEVPVVRRCQARLSALVGAPQAADGPRGVSTASVGKS